MRLFVAVRPPAEAVADLASVAGALQATLPDLRWVDPPRWHVTVVFLGDVPDTRTAELERRLGRVSARHAPLRLRFTGGGRFGDRVLFTNVGGDRDAARRLAASTAAAARRTGIAVDERRYRPHLTLARSRGGTDLRPAVRALEGYQGVEWTADALRLVRSRLGGGPGHTSSYETVASWTLAGRT